MADGKAGVGDSPVNGATKQPEPEAVRQQLERILASAPFRHSKRCAPFLRYVVTEVLEGRGAALKERRIGMDVFDRETSYDTSTDPVVRTTANEVRKRLAQYYQTPSTEAEIQITVPVYHYAPQFRCPEPADAEDLKPRPETPIAEPPEAHTEARAAATTRRRWLPAVAFIAVAATAVGVSYFARIWRDPVADFWAPFLQSSEPVTVAVGEALTGVFPETVVTDENSRAVQIGFPDSIVQAEVVGALQSRGRQPQLKVAGGLALQDFKKGPVVLIGAFNNLWSMRLQEQLRFYIESDASHVRILDRQNPNVRIHDSTRGAPASPVDHGLVARFIDSRTRQPVLMIAGIGGGATRAAGEFVTRADFLKELAARAPSGWSGNSVEAVIAVDVVRGSIGSPRIAAVHFW